MKRTSTEIKVGLADEQIVLTDCLADYLGRSEHVNCKVEWSVNSGRDLMNQLEKEPVDILVMELRLPDVDGLDLIGDIRKQMPGIRICVLTQYLQSKFIKSSFKEGADAFVIKQSGVEELEKALLQVSVGETYMGKGVSYGPQKSVGNGSPRKKEFDLKDPYLVKASLTERETEVIKYISRGLSAKEIAGQLYISDQTVAVHRKNIMKKLKVNSTQALVQLVRENALIPTDS